MTQVAKDLRPKGDPDLMRKHARTLMHVAGELREEQGRCAQRKVEGEGPLVNRTNRREDERWKAFDADALKLEDAAKMLVDAAAGLETAQSKFDRDAKNVKRGPDR